MSNNVTARLVSSRDLSIGGRNFIVSRLLSWDWFYVVFFSSDVTSVVRVVPSLRLRVMLLLRLRTAVDLVVVVVVPVCVCVNIKKSEDSKETFGSTSIIERKKIKRWDENVKRYICTQVHERERERERDSERVREREGKGENTHKKSTFREKLRDSIRRLPDSK